MAKGMSRRKTETTVLSMDKETKLRLQRYAEQKHNTISQLVTDWIWSVSVKDAPVPAPEKAAE